MSLKGIHHFRDVKYFKDNDDENGDIERATMYMFLSQKNQTYEASSEYNSFFTSLLHFKHEGSITVIQTPYYG